MSIIRRYLRAKNWPYFLDVYSSYFARICSKDESIPYTDDTVLVYVLTTFKELTYHVN